MSASRTTAPRLSSAGARAAARADVERWLATYVDRLDPLCRGDAAEVLFRRKCFGELTIYLSVAGTLGGGADRSAFQRLRDHVLACVRPELVDLASQDTGGALLLAGPLAYALQAGALDGPTADRARRLLTSDIAWGFEMPAHRMLSLAFACRAAGVSPKLHPRHLAQASSLRAPPSPATSPDNAWYAFTHSALYAHLLGVTTRSDGALAAGIDGAIGRCLVTDQMDLGLELATASAILGCAASAARLAVVTRAIGQIVEDGRMAPVLRGPVVRFREARPEEAIWADSFHVMIVAAIAFGLTGAGGDDAIAPPEAAQQQRVEHLGGLYAALLAGDAGPALAAMAQGHSAGAPLARRQREIIARALDLARPSTHVADPAPAKRQRPDPVRTASAELVSVDARGARARAACTGA